MDALTRAAVAGTSRETPPASGLPTDGLFESAAGKSPERELLLRAGTRAVYRAAGLVAESGIDAPQPAPDETIPVCSAKAAELLGRLLVDQRTTILLEALERLRLAGLRLPHALLPGAMNVEQEELRPAVAAVLGERGRWLARLNPEWAWAVGDEGDLRDVWDEGALKERTSVLRRVRERDPALGREWLSEAWRQEKADARSAMLEAFEENLSPEDEPFLESSLGDRSMKVRAVAADLLARLPGSARSLLWALDELRPDAVLVEGPSDAEAVLPLMARPQMQPPVALLVYPPDAPQDAAYYPFARFSPEWNALRYALGSGVTARFVDLPRALDLEDEDDAEPEVREDPIGLLAEAAGYEDRELWWERQVEQRRDATDLFDAIIEAMAALREDYEPPPREARREAYMRREIRKTLQQGHENIAVVCGAWHAPALRLEGHAVKSDDALLKGLKKRKTSATWIPWTTSRLSYRSGYGAGIASPGYYEHLWSSPEGSVASRWLSLVARLLRSEDLEASPANVVEAARVADTLAAIRDLPAPGLDELREAALATLCGGETERLALIRDRLEIGEKLGEVPAETPTVPLQRDLEGLQKRLCLKPSAEERHLDLDLREVNGRARSELLHRLRLLGVGWGEPHAVSGKSGTFHEVWTLQWRPELSLALIEANVWGNTVESASASRVRELAETADLPSLTALLDAAILARLPESAVGHLLGRMRDNTASADVRGLMDALPPLARVARYGDVRGTAAASVLPVIDVLFERALVSLPGACTSLDDDAAREMAESIAAGEECVNLLDRSGMHEKWRTVLGPLAENESVNALLRGWCCRLLLEAGSLDEEELRRLAGLSLSPAAPATEAAAWVEGVLRGSGLVLLHQTGLWMALDGWLTGLDPETFTSLLPLVRRAFSDFEPAEKRAMGERVRKLGSGGEAGPARGYDGTGELDHRRAARTLPVLAQILGVERDG